MASRTTFTASVVVPAKIRWKCSKCGSINTAESSVGVARQATTSRLNTSGLEEENSKALQAEWMSKVLDIMTDPNNHASEFRNGVYKKGCRCSHCNNKEFWAKDQWYLRLIPLIVVGGLFTGIGALFAEPMVPGLWIAFAIFLGAFVYVMAEESTYTNKLSELSADLLPRFITDNKD